MALISLGVLYGTEFKDALANRYVGYLAGLFGLLISNMALYATASLMDPGTSPRVNQAHRSLSSLQSHSPYVVSVLRDELTHPVALLL